MLIRHRLTEAIVLANVCLQLTSKPFFNNKRAEEARAFEAFKRKNVMLDPVPFGELRGDYYWSCILRKIIIEKSQPIIIPVNDLSESANVGLS